MTEETVSDREMFIAGIIVDPASNAPIVLLKDAEGKECVPIWIGVNEANSITQALKRAEVTRPMTHDLMKNIFDELDVSVKRIHIRALEENTFYASIELLAKGDLRCIDARPSDALAIAVRMGAQITIDPQVLERAKINLIAINPEEMLNPQDLPSDNSSVNDLSFQSMDKEKWEEILAEMDPEDFKYKM
ncbi:MAG: bifunctional nuclease family protein [Deltaproteobacteria bacterium]|nr:bifunctional nuclease family protein [Deltaproteobacteria bacterium]